jgi:hypothetical protein
MYASRSGSSFQGYTLAWPAFKVYVLVTRLLYGMTLHGRLIKVLLSDVLSTQNCVFRGQSAVLMSRVSAGSQMVLMAVLLGVQLCISPGLCSV